MAGVARWHSRTDRLRAGWARLLAHKGGQRAETGRDSASRIALLFGNAAPCGLGGISGGVSGEDRADSIAYRGACSPGCGNRTASRRRKGGRVALRDRARSILWRGKVLAAGAVRLPRGSPDFGM